MNIKCLRYSLIFYVAILLQPLALKAQEDMPMKGSLYYSGLLGGEVKIEFNLRINGYITTGSYIVDSSGDLFVFNGRMASDKSGIGVFVYDDASQYIASIEAKFLSTENNFAKEINGLWKSADGIKKMTLTLVKIGEFANIQGELDKKSVTLLTE